MAKNDFLYQKTYEQIKEKIILGEYAEGTRLPLEPELRDTYGVSIITIKKALEMLAEKNYIKRVPGKGTFVLKHNKKVGKAANGGDLLGLILEHVATPYGLAMMYEMDRMADKAGYKLCIRFSYGKREKETEEIKDLLARSVQGLIVMPSHGEHYNPMLLKLSLDKFPLVLVDKKMKGIPVPSVRTDNAEAMKELVKQAAREGCNRIAMLTTDDTDATSIEERRKGFKDGMRELGLEPVAQHKLKSAQEDMTVDTPSPEMVEAIAGVLQEIEGRFDAVVCLEYSLVPPLVRACAKLGIAPFKDFKIYTVDEDYLAPGGYTFTHMKQDERAIGSKTVELLLEAIEGKEIQQEDYLIPAELRVAQPQH